MSDDESSELEIESLQKHKCRSGKVSREHAPFFALLGVLSFLLLFVLLSLGGVEPLLRVVQPCVSDILSLVSLAQICGLRCLVRRSCGALGARLFLFLSAQEA